jgi:hypothetical protein
MSNEFKVRVMQDASQSVGPDITRSAMYDALFQSRSSGHFL